MGQEVIDPHKFEGRYKNWKEKNRNIKGLDDLTSKTILQYLEDLENGRNITKGVKKGRRSYSRVYASMTKLIFIFKILKKRGYENLNISEDAVTQIFNVDMRAGIIKKKDGTTFKSTGDYAKTFSAFWHWWVRVNKKKNKNIKDIASDLDTSREENDFVYFTKEQLDEMLEHFTKEESVMLLFMFDTIIRCPKELMNLRKSDLSSDYKQLTIREETAKTYGRTIKLMLSSESVKEYSKDFQEDDLLFEFSPPLLNRKLKKVVVKLFGDKKTLGGKKYSEISLYDFRHSGACYWRKGAYHQKIDALMYRGGWSDLRILNYYTKKLGMKDNITEEDLLDIEDLNKVGKLEEQIKKIKERFDEFKKERLEMLYAYKEKMEKLPEQIKAKKK